MKQFKVIDVLVYYDLPEIIVAIDSVDTKFLCMLIEEVPALKYVAVPVSNNRINNFSTGKIDLLTIFENPEYKEYHILNMGDAESEFLYEDSLINYINLEWLPEEGFFLNEPFDDDSTIIEEAYEKDNAIIHLAISDEKDDFGISTDDLGDIVKLYSNLLEYSFKKAVLHKKLPQPKSFTIKENYEIRAFSSSAASFNLHLYSESNKNLFGEPMITLGLEKISEIFEDHQNDDNLIQSLKTIKGHAVSSYSRILKKIVNRNLKIKHKWYSKNLDKAKVAIIDTNKASKILGILNRSIELSEEIITVVGHFIQVDSPNNTWKLKKSEDNKVIVGTAARDALAGVVIETSKYEVVCEEIIEEREYSEKEKVTHIIKSIKELEK